MSNRWSKALIVGGAANVPQRCPCEDGKTLVICADSGAGTLRHWGIRPQWIVGDMDSINADDQAYWERRGVEFRRFPVEKDKTDVDLAVDYALAEDVPEIWITGAWGGRVDHSLGNIEILYRLAQLGVPCRLITDDGYLTVITEAWEDTVVRKSTVSLLPMTPKVSGITTDGLRFPLNDATLQRGSTLGVSNHAPSGSFRVTITSGLLLVMVAPPQPGI